MISTSKKGFTLIELMIVLIIIGSLVAVSIPKLNSVILKSKQNVNITNLNLLREGLTSYYGDNGTYPVDDLSSLYPKYISKIPKLDIPDSGHSKSSLVITVSSTDTIEDSGHWAYVNVSSSPYFGSVFIDCSHLTLTGKRYCDY